MSGAFRVTFINTFRIHDTPHADVYLHRHPAPVVLTQPGNRKSGLHLKYLFQDCNYLSQTPQTHFLTALYWSVTVTLRHLNTINHSELLGIYQSYSLVKQSCCPKHLPRDIYPDTSAETLRMPVCENWFTKK